MHEGQRCSLLVHEVCQHGVGFAFTIDGVVEVFQAALAAIANATEGKNVVKVIVIPGRLVNVVVK